MRGVRPADAALAVAAGLAVLVSATELEVPDAGFSCAPVPQGFCSDIFPNGTLAFMWNGQESLLNSIAELMVQQIAQNTGQTTRCFSLMARLVCHQIFKPCFQASSSSMLPRPVCRENCFGYYKSCDSEAARSLGQYEFLPECGVPEFSSDEKTSEPNVYGENMWIFNLLLYPKSFAGRSMWPEAFYSMTLDDASTIQVPCVSSEELWAGTQAVVETEECQAPFTERDSLDRCVLPCPHPMYTREEYKAMYDIYCIPGLLISVIALAGLVNVCFTYCCFCNPKMRAATKRPTFYYQSRVAASFSVFAITGPLTVLYDQDTETFGMTCTEKYLPHSHDVQSKDSYKPMSSYCRSNLVSFIGMLLGFNVFAVHLYFIQHQFSSIVEKHSTAARLSRNFLMNLALLEPLVIGLLLVFSYDLFPLKKSDAAYHGNLARWTVFCGPHLSLENELLLVHFPFMFTGVCVAVLSVKILILFRRFHAGSSSSDHQQNSTEATIKIGVRTMAKKLAVLGLISSSLVLAYTLIVVQEVPQISAVGDLFSDMSVCYQVYRVRDPTTGEFEFIQGITQNLGLKTATTCEDLAIKVTDSGLEIEGSANSGALMLILLIQNAMPFVITVFYFSMLSTGGSVRTKYLVAVKSQNQLRRMTRKVSHKVARRLSNAVNRNQNGQVVPINSAPGSAASSTLSSASSNNVVGNQVLGDTATAAVEPGVEAPAAAAAVGASDKKALGKIEEQSDTT